jgi:hypothetical protein
MKRLLLVTALLLAACGGTQPPGSQTVEVKNQTFSAALDRAAAAEVSLSVPFQKAFISALEGSDTLVEAEVEYIGEMTFDVEGDTAKSVRLSEDTKNLLYDGDRPLRWNVRLNPDVPLNLAVDLASGELSVDATGLNLSNLVLRTASGLIDADLPATADRLPIQVDVMSGSMNINLPASAQADLTRIGMASGQLNIQVGAGASVTVSGVTINAGGVVIDVPNDAAVRLEIKSVASGSVNLAFSLTRLAGTDPDEGVWETEGFADADHQIQIVVESVASGTFELR